MFVNQNTNYSYRNKDLKNSLTMYLSALHNSLRNILAGLSSLVQLSAVVCMSTFSPLKQLCDKCFCTA